MIPHLHYKNILKIMFPPQKIANFSNYFQIMYNQEYKTFLKNTNLSENFFLYGVEDSKHNICTREKTPLHISFSKLYWIKLEEMCQRSTC